MRSFCHLFCTRRHCRTFPLGISLYSSRHGANVGMFVLCRVTLAALPWKRTDFTSSPQKRCMKFSSSYQTTIFLWDYLSCLHEACDYEFGTLISFLPAVPKYHYGHIYVCIYVCMYAFMYVCMHFLMALGFVRCRPGFRFWCAVPKLWCKAIYAWHLTRQYLFVTMKIWRCAGVQRVCVSCSLHLHSVVWECKCALIKQNQYPDIVHACRGCLSQYISVQKWYPFLTVSMTLLTNTHFHAQETPTWKLDWYPAFEHSCRSRDFMLFITLEVILQLSHDFIIMGAIAWPWQAVHHSCADVGELRAHYAGFFDP